MAVELQQVPGLVVYRDNGFMHVNTLEEGIRIDSYPGLITRKSGPGPLLDAYVWDRKIAPARLLATDEEATGSKIGWARRWANKQTPRVEVLTWTPNECDLAEISRRVGRRKKLGSIDIQDHQELLCLVLGPDGTQLLRIDSSGNRTPVDGIGTLPFTLDGLRVGAYAGKQVVHLVRTMMAERSQGVGTASRGIPCFVIAGSARRLHRRPREQFETAFSETLTTTVERGLGGIAGREASLEGPQSSPAWSRIGVPRAFICNHHTTLDGLVALSR